MAHSSKISYPPPVCSSADITITPARKSHGPSNSSGTSSLSPPLLSREEEEELFGLAPEDDNSFYVRESKIVRGSRQISSTLPVSSVGSTKPSAKRAKTVKAPVHNEISAGLSTPTTEENTTKPKLSAKAKGKRKAGPELPASPMPSKIARTTSSSPRPKSRKTAEELDTSSFRTWEYVDPRSSLEHQSAPAEASTSSTHVRPQSRTPSVPRPQVQRAQAAVYPAHVAPLLRTSQAPSPPPALAQSSRQAVVHENRVTRALPKRVQQLNPISTLKSIPQAARTAHGAPQRQVDEAPVLHTQSWLSDTQGPVLAKHAVSQASQAPVPVLSEPPAVDPYEAWYHDQQTQAKEAEAQERFTREVRLRYSDEAAYNEQLLSDYDVNSPAANYQTTVPGILLDLEYFPPLKDDNYYPYTKSTYSTLVDEHGRYPHVSH